jgi:hypothetical protein
MSQKNKIFETADVDLGSFLCIHDVPYVDCRVEADPKTGRARAILRFLDDKQNARDLERMFITSEMKKFRDVNKFLLKEVHRACDLIKKQIVEGD